MRTVFFDVDTQMDFLFPAGALYVPGAETLVPALVRLNRHAAANGFPLISTMDAHEENDVEFREWPPHCVAGTFGQRKPEQTLLPDRNVVPATATRLPAITAGQVIVEKLTTNCFHHPNLMEFLDSLAAECYVVYGVTTEVCVKFAAMGLLHTGKRVELVSDAVRHLTETASDAMLSEFQNAGGVLTSVDQVCG